MFIDELMCELIDEVSCGLCFEVHRACKLGTIFLDETDIELVTHVSCNKQCKLLLVLVIVGVKMYTCNYLTGS